MCCKFHCWQNCMKSALLNGGLLSVIRVSDDPSIVFEFVDGSFCSC